MQYLRKEDKGGGVDMKCDYCTEKCPQSETIREIAKGRMYATNEVVKLQKQLEEYKDLEKQSLLLRLPCGIGADIYFVPSKSNFKLNILQGYPQINRVYHQTVERITFTENGWYLECGADLEFATGHIMVDESYKETWFLTQAEAEQKLKEMEGHE